MSTAVASPTSPITSNADIFESLNKKATAGTPESTASADRFLTMLVTQLQNQDPLNPMDNAQITSQMAQINAVTGLDKVNESVKSLNGQLLQMQALQGAALVGREVSLDGDRLSLDKGVGRGALELNGSASAVKVEVLDGAKQVVGTINLGPRDAGRHSFDWDGSKQPSGGNYSFRVAATNGGTAVAARTLMIDRVQSVSTAGETLTLTLARNGQTPASQVVTFN